MPSSSAHQDSPVTIDSGDRQVTRQIVVAAPAHELFRMIANPHRHSELDGSGSVKATVSGPSELALGDIFTMSMRQMGMPYRTKSTVTALTPDELIEWQLTGGHRWRWELRAIDATATEVTETFDYSDSSMARVLEVMGVPRRNGQGIESTLEQLRKRFA